MTYLSGFASPNPTRDLWNWTLISQIILCITVLTSCVPYLRPLLESLPSGLYASDQLRRRGTSLENGHSASKSGSYQLDSHSSRGGGGKQQSNSYKREWSTVPGYPILPQGRTTRWNSASGLPGGPRRPEGEIDVEITATFHHVGEGRRWETDSTGSRSKILKTTVMTTEWEEAQRISRDVSVKNNVGTK